MIDCMDDVVTWIPVDEELPGYRIPVLFWVEEETIDTEAGGYFGWYSNKVYDGKRGQWFDIYNNVVYGVTHWMPFPKGPDCHLIVAIKVEEYD